MPVKSVRASSIVAIVLLLTLAGILFATSSRRHRPTPAMRSEELLGEEARTFDSPGEAQEFYRFKRAPGPDEPIPVERYMTANEQVKAMPEYSTSSGTYGANLGSWTSLGPGNIGGRTRALVIDPNDPTLMYAGGVAGGVWKSTNGGSSWAPKGDLLPNLAITTIAMDTFTPPNSRTLYAGTGEVFSAGVRGAGIFKSTDSGEHWAQLSGTATPVFYYVNDIVISPNNHNVIYAGTWIGDFPHNGAVWKSTNAGQTWTVSLGPGNPGLFGGCLDLAIRTDRTTDYLFASCGFEGFRDAVIYRNTDANGTGTWDPVHTESGMARTSLAIAPSNQNTIYAMAEDFVATSQHALRAIFKSTNGGSSWTAVLRALNPPVNLNSLLLTNPTTALCCNSYSSQGQYDNVLAVDPTNENRVWAGGIDLFRSDDGGANWGIASHWHLDRGNPHFVHADQHVIKFHPGYDGITNKTLFVANDGGIFRTSDALAGTGSCVPCAPYCSQAACSNDTNISWTSLNNGYGVTQFYNGLPLPDGTAYIGGTQDNGTLKGSDTNGANGWETKLGGDGGYVAVDRVNPNTLFAETVFLSLVKSTDGGSGWQLATNGITENPANFLFITPFTMDPNNSQRLWIGGISMWRTNDGANNWSRASAQLTFGGAPEKTSAIAVSPLNPNWVLAGTSLGVVFRTDSGNSSNASINWNPVVVRAGGFVSSVTFDPSNDSIAYATIASFKSIGSDRHVYKSTDAGQTWTGIDGTGATGIPDVPVHSIVVDPGNSSRLYIGTDVGVLVSNDGGGSWARENTGFANCVTESLSLNTVGGTTSLYAFTHGRGVWRVALDTPPASTVNLALNKMASQSSTDYGGVAGRAVDGNPSGIFTNNSITATSSEYRPWWDVDLGAVQSIHSVLLWNRTDCCGDRLQNFYVFVSDNPFPSNDPEVLATTAGVANRLTQGQAGETTAWTFNRSGRYVRVQLRDANILSLSEVQVFGTPSGPQPTNLALNKLASQSTTDYGGAAGRAVDGNTSGVFTNNSVTATSDEYRPWWGVDLGAVQSIQNIMLWNRTDCPCADRLQDFYVFVSDNPFPSNDPEVLATTAGVFNQRFAGQAGAPTTFLFNRSGRYVRVQLRAANILSLAEVQVIGIPGSAPTNLALNKPASQSTTDYGGIASRAVDGNTSGVFTNLSITATAGAFQDWWQVDLGAPSTIQTVTVHNRTDCCWERLNNSQVLVSDAPFGTRTLSQLLADPTITSIPIPFQPPDQPPAPSLTFQVNRSGRYVRVQLSQANILSLAEVQVVGTSH